MTYIPKNLISQYSDYTFLSVQAERIPSNYIKLEKEDDIVHMQRLLDALDDNDDVQNVWHNWDEPEEA